MAMIEAYRIGVELVLGGDLAAGLEALVPSLTRLDDSLAHANADAKALAAGLQAVAAASPGLDRAADAMGRLNAAMASMNRAVEHWRAGGGVAGLAAPGDRAVGMAAASAERRTTPSGRAAKDADPTPPSSARPGSGMEPGRKAAGLPIDAIPAASTAASTLAVPYAAYVAAQSKPAMTNGAAGLATVLAAIQSQPLVAQAASAGRRVEGTVPGPDVSGQAAAGPIVAHRKSAGAAFDLERVLATVAARQPITSVAQADLEPDWRRETETAAQRSPGTVSDIVLSQPNRRQRAEQPGFDSWRVLQPIVRDGVGAVPVVRSPLPDPSAAGRRRETGSETAAPLRMPAAIAPGMAPQLRIGKVLNELTDWLGARQVKPTRDHAAVATPGIPPVKTAPGVQAPAMAASRDGLSTVTAGLLAMKHAANRLPVALQSGIDGVAIGGLGGRPSQVVTVGGRRSSAAPAGAAPYRAMETVRTAVGDGLGALQSYHKQGEPNGPVIQHVTYIQLDERTIARAVTRQQLRMMGGQVSGTLRPDPSIAPQYGAHLLEN